MSLARQFDAYRAWREHLDHQVVRLRDWLRDADLLDAQAEQQLRRIRGRLAEDKLVVAFVAEFSRGKSELINALFFADRGGRVLPSAAGRTTMCPTEISWEPGQSPGITLLPIETRAEGTSIAELRGAPEAWQTFPFDPAAPESMASALRRVGDVKNMPAEAARGLGFAVGDSADGSLVADDEGLVEVPRWRHAMIRFPHPLLEQGLVVLDTPGLNAIGAEPELTLSLLPGVFQTIARFSPMQLWLYFPIQLILNKQTPADIALNFGLQAFWLAVMFVIFRATWSAGLKKYSAVGA